MFLIISMKHIFFFLVLFFAISCSNDEPSVMIPNDTDDSDPVGSGNNDVLVWSDEFDYEGSIDEDTWTIEYGNGEWGWGNSESQFYTSSNLEVSNGTLKIHAKKEYTYGYFYSSGRIHTGDSYSFQYGKMEVRAKLPSNKGTWPAIWLLGESFLSGTPWPDCGEIDLMEQTGANKNKILGTVHWKSSDNNASYPNRANPESTNIGIGEILISTAASEFHIYTMDWTKNSIKMYLDGDLFFTFPIRSSHPFDNPFYIILNTAVGGTLGGNIDSNFPDDVMEIDYVRVYQ